MGCASFRHALLGCCCILGNVIEQHLRSSTHYDTRALQQRAKDANASPEGHAAILSERGVVPAALNLPKQVQFFLQSFRFGDHGVHSSLGLVAHKLRRCSNGANV